MRVFNIENISLCVFDDADIVSSTDLMKQQIVNSLDSECRKLVISFNSGFEYGSIVKPPYTAFKGENELNVDQCYMKCEFATKIRIIAKIHDILAQHHAQAIIFCSVKFFQLNLDY